MTQPFEFITNKRIEGQRALSVLGHHVSRGAFHFANFSCKSNGTAILWKIHSEIEHLKTTSRSSPSPLSVRNRTGEISLTFTSFSSFQSLASQKQLWEIKL